MTGLNDTDIRLNSEWQLTQATDGDAPLCSGLECLYQNIVLEALTQPGDVFYDAEFGWGLYDNILVKSSVTVSQNISVTVTTDTADTDEAVENRVKAILTELLAVRRSRKLNELTLSDINHAIRSGYSGATNAAVSEPEADVKLGKDKVITLGDVSVTVERE